MAQQLDPPIVNGFTSLSNPMFGKLAAYTEKCKKNEGFFKLKQDGTNEYKVTLKRHKDTGSYWYEIKIILRYIDDKNKKKYCNFVAYKKPLLVEALGQGYTGATGGIYRVLEDKQENIRNAMATIINNIYLKYNLKSTPGHGIVLDAKKDLLDTNRLHVFMRGLRYLILELPALQQYRHDPEFESRGRHIDQTADAKEKIAQAIDSDADPIEALKLDDAIMSQSGGSKYKKTSIRVSTDKGMRCLYEGPRGGKYVKISGKYVRYQK